MKARDCRIKSVTDNRQKQIHSLFSYYLSSPFNFLILLFMQFLYVNEAVTLVVLLKIGLTGAFMAWYVLKKKPGQELTAVCTGCMYALSNYVLGYYSNLMWLDCVMLLPVFAWTIERLVQTGHWRIYAVVLGYCILSNYYMGFILCVFSVLYFIAVYFEAGISKGRWWKCWMKFSGLLYWAEGTALCLAFCAAVGTGAGNLKILGTAGIVLIYFSILVQKPQQRIPWQTWLSILLLCEIGFHGFFSICNNGTANRDLYEKSRKELRQAVGRQGNADHYRTAIVNPVLRNEELLYGLNGISMFSSTNTDAMQIWMEKMGFETGKNRFQYAGETELMDMLLGIRYLACRNTISMSTAYVKIYSGNYFDLYENPRALADGYLVDNSIQEFRLEGRNPFEVQNQLLCKMGAGTLYRTAEAAALPGFPGVLDNIFEIRLKGGEHGYLWIPGAEPPLVEIDGRRQQYDFWNNNFLDLGYSDQDRTVQVKASENGIAHALLGICEQSRLDDIYRRLSKNEIQMRNGSGSIQADRDGIVFFRSFYDQGIHLQVDGKDVQTLNLEGMLGVRIKKGRHTITIRYETPGLGAGTAISLLCTGILLAYPVWNKMKHCRQKRYR